MPTKLTRSLVLLVVTVATVATNANAETIEELQRVERVRQAAMMTYVHGMTDAIAEEVVGTEGVPALLELLEEPAFPRRDNVVAFLAHLAGNESTDPLMRCLNQPPAPVETPEEERAMLLIPQALGRIAARDGGAALDQLVDWTADRLTGFSAAFRADLTDQALRGLALSGTSRAKRQLQRLSEGSRNTRLTSGARQALELLTSPGITTSTPRGIQEVASDDSASVGTLVDDSAPRSNEAPLSFANHVAVTNPITDEAVDHLMQSASVSAGHADFSSDVACCTTIRRSGSALSFGQNGDGLDIIDNATELNSVLLNNVSRVKVVRMINDCGGAGSNIIGCSYSPGRGMAVVRVSSAVEGNLWLHEYGHNTGITQHNPDSRYVMYFALSQGTVGVSDSECALFHNPPSSTNISTVDIGVCHDDDADDYASSIDNCPNISNPSQSDINGDGAGDACQSCPDADGDGFGSPPTVNCIGGPILDCNDFEADIFPGAPQLCDGINNDCSDPTWPAVPADERDNDGDGFFPCEGDCDDGADEIYAGAPAICDGVNNDCNDPAWPALDGTNEVDIDGDGFAECDGDCDETLLSVYPGAAEICDGEDNDCDHFVDEAICSEFDASGDSRVDGVELVWVGRAFGLCSALPQLEWWDSVDYNGDGCVDGSDLAILSLVFGCTDNQPICD